MTDKLWIVEIQPGVGEVEWPDLRELFTVHAADTDWSLVEASYGDLERAIDDHALRISGHPIAGKYIDIGGDEIFVDDDADIVEDAEAVATSLDWPGMDECGLDAEDYLHHKNRMF